MAQSNEAVWNGKQKNLNEVSPGRSLTLLSVLEYFYDRDEIEANLLFPDERLLHFLLLDLFV